MPKAKAKPKAVPKLGPRFIHDRWVACDRNAEETARVLNLGKSGARTVRRAVTVFQEQQQGTRDVAPKRGRAPILDVQGLTNLKKLAERAKREQHIIRPELEDCKRYLLEERKKMLVFRLKRIERMELCDPQLRNFPVSAEVELKYIHKIWPEQNKSREATDNREKKKAQLRNFISACAVGGVVFDDTNPECIITHDSFAVYLDEKGRLRKTYAAAGSSQDMRGSNLSIGAKSKPGLAEAAAKLPCHSSIAMSGKLIALICEIWDSLI